MSPMLDIGRLDIALHGVPADLAEAAASGLEDALRRRLGGLRLDRSGSIPELRLDALDLPRGVDGPVLRELIAAHLLEAIGRMPAGEPEELS